MFKLSKSNLEYKGVFKAINPPDEHNSDYQS